ncbi:heterokaryon incompatibility protein-domain-containing protein [Paraphoma chrysanthemicola]|nr:heterokaryon incompatibility protein-domain-containing protein [Paraphoma chrysanthemicola]
MLVAQCANMSLQSVSDYGYDCHFCKHCPTLLIDVRDARPRLEIVLSYFDFTNAIREGCQFYTWMFWILRHDSRELYRTITSLSKDQTKFRELPTEQQTMLLKCSSENIVDQLEVFSPYHSITINFDDEATTSISSSMASFTKKTKLSIHYMLNMNLSHLLRKGGSVLKSPLSDKPTETSTAWMRIFALSDGVEQDGVKSLHVTNRPLHTTLSSYSSLSIARRWLTECKSTHKECQTISGRMPTRVLDVGTDNELFNVKLHTTREGQTDPYAALTYCWGGDQIAKAVAANVAQLQAGLDLGLLPQTIKDAICVTRGLGLRYLWVDCLCIIQDDDDDVAWEISNMASVFLGATVTISASSAKASTEGFLDPGKRKCVKISSSVLRFGISPATPFRIYLEWPHQYSAREEPLATRAWTLQERVLSTRILDYCGKSAWWVCHTEAKSQDGTFGGNGPPTYFYHPPGVLGQRHPGDMRSTENSVYVEKFQPTPLAAWKGTVEEYSRRKMTFGKDKLLAISGIAAEYAKLFQCEYLAGLWQFDLISELAWYVTKLDFTNATNPVLPRLPRPKVWRAPSWSWAAVDGVVASHSLLFRGRSDLVVHEAKAQPVSPIAPFGALQADQCYLIVEGYLKQLWVKTDVNHRNLFSSEESEIAIGSSHLDALEPPSNELSGYNPAWTLFLESDRGLLLASTEKECFRRMGTFISSGEHKQVWSEDLKRQRIKII